MANINKPMDVPELNLRPPITEKVRLSEDMQQTLALLTGYHNSIRKVLKASESGILYTTNPRIKDLWGFKGLNDFTHKQGVNTPCNEVMITGHPDNNDKIWVRPYTKYDPTPVTGNFAWPVGAGDVVGFVVSNINQLWFYFKMKDDIIIVAYTM